MVEQNDTVAARLVAEAMAKFPGRGEKTSGKKPSSRDSPRGFGVFSDASDDPDDIYFPEQAAERAALRAQRATGSAKSTSATSRCTVPKKRDADALFMEFLDKSIKKLENQQTSRRPRAWLPLLPLPWRQPSPQRSRHSSSCTRRGSSPRISSLRERTSSSAYLSERGCVRVWG